MSSPSWSPALAPPSHSRHITITIVTITITPPDTRLELPRTGARLICMHPSAASDARYPIGRFVATSAEFGTDPAARLVALRDITELPGRLEAALQGLAPGQLDTAYRDGGWTLRQLIHHVADSHINAYARLRLALTEDWPTIKPYQEALWSELPDALSLPVETSLALLVPLHQRWSYLLSSLDEKAWTERGYTHPENGDTNIAGMTALYSWHGRHHTAHVLALRTRMGW